MPLSDYFGGAKKRKEQIDKALAEGTTPKASVRAKQPAQPAVKKATGTDVNKGKKCPMWIRSGDCGRLGYTAR